MNKLIDDSMDGVPDGALETGMRELLGDVQHQPIPPRLRELALRLEEALAAARLRDPQAD